MNPGVGLKSALGLTALLGLLCGLSGCDGCGSKKPYTPFGVASAVPDVVPAPSELPNSAPPASAASGFAVHKAELVPSASETWQGSGLSLSAPAGQRFAQVLPAHFDDDQKLDALAWLVPAPEQQHVAPSELWYFPASSPARKLSSLPGFVPSSPDCTLSTSLTQTGPHSATLDVAATCSTKLLSRAPARALVVVSPNGPHPVLLTLRAASPASDETLNFSVDSSDQDRDGQDDVKLTLSLTTLDESTAASADLIWFDRAAGTSRSASEPVASLLRSAHKIALQARGKSAAQATRRVLSVLRLLSSLCAESGVPRVFDEDGAALRCGDLGKVIDSLGMSEVTAALARGDTLSAYSVLLRDGWYFKKFSQSTRKALDRELLRAVTAFDLEPPSVARARPSQLELPHYSPLWFESDGALLIHGSSGVTRWAANSSTEEPASGDGGVPDWPLDLALPNGNRVLGAVHACDRSELSFNESDAQHPLLPPVATRLLAARPASCAGRGTGPVVSIAPLSFDENGLEALVAGARVSVATPGKQAVAGLPAIGTPRSPDGRWLVTPSPLGLLVIGDRKELWQTGKLSEHADATLFRDCVIANEARAVACVESGHAILFARPKPTTRAKR